MKNYIQISISINSVYEGEEISNDLANIGYDGFEETNEGLLLKAFIMEEAFNEMDLRNILEPLGKSYTKNLVESQNWNALWESNFEPVVVDDKISIRASFHATNPNTAHEIVITPKMSFGTGHHATTYMCLQLMQKISFTNKEVYDFGTGTGILAIHAAQLGATSIVAVDNDDWCIENSIENIEQNNCKNIVIKKVETAEINSAFDVVIANVNRHIIIDNFSYLETAVKQNGFLIISGITQQDEQEMENLFSTKGFKKVVTLNKDNGLWVAILFDKKL